MLADLPVGDILVRKADGGRRPKAIREIPAKENCTVKSIHRLSVTFAVLVGLSLHAMGAGTARWQIKQDTPEGKLPKLAKPLVLDAKLDEWEGATSLLLRYASYIIGVTPGHEWRGPKDASAEMYCAWNDDGLCLAVIVADDTIHNERPPGLTWQQDSLEIFIDGRVGEKFMKPPYSKGAYQLFVRPPVGKLPAALHVNNSN